MSRRTNHRYSHIESFEDFESEKMKLYFQLKFSQRKLQLKYMELGLMLNPAKLIPMLVTDWLNPILVFFKNLILQFFNRKKSDDKTDGQDE